MRCDFRLRTIFVLVALLLCLGYGSANAFNVPTGVDDLTFRVDNTVRYLLQHRLNSYDDDLVANPSGDDGDRNFDRGIVSNRLDLLVESDLIYKGFYGFRASGAFWFDQRYKEDFDNDSVATSNYLVNGVPTIGLYDDADDRYAGPDGELLDCFAFGRLELFGIPNYIKVGRHVLFFGDSLLTAFHGINYAQSALDLGKAQANPGIEAKEVFRPLNQVSLVSQVTSGLTLKGSYVMKWEKDLLPAAGTFFATSDLSVEGPGALILAPGWALNHGRDIEPDKSGEFGVAARWSPYFLKGDTIGIYYRKFADKLPTAILNFGTNTYHFAYASDIDLYGISWAGMPFGISTGAEVSYRHDMPLISDTAIVMSDAALPAEGEVLAARGDTLHAVLNVLGLLKRTPVWDAGSWMAEVAYSEWLNVNSNESLFKGRDSYTGFDAVTKDNMVISATFSPQWMQIWPGVDLTVPITASYGIFGVSSVALGGSEEDGSWGIGLNFDYLTKYKINLGYTNYFGSLGMDTTPPTTRGTYTAMRDRDFISLTLKTSF